MRQIPFGGNGPPISSGGDPSFRSEYFHEDLYARLSEYWKVFRRRWQIIILIFISAILVTAYHTSKMKPVFRGTATIQINKERQQISEIKEVVAYDSYDVDFYPTQQKLLSTRSLVKRVIHSLKLTEHPEFISGSGKPSNGPNEMTNEDQLVDQFLRRLKIEPIRNSRLVRIHFDSTYPDLARDAPNTLATIYIQQDLELRLNATRQAKTLLGEQLAVLKKKIEQAEEKLQKFTMERNAISFEERENLDIQRLVFLNEALIRAEADRSAKEGLYNKVKNQDWDSLPDVMNNRYIQYLKEAYHQLGTQYTKLSETTNPDDPEVVYIKKQMESIKRNISTEVSNAVAFVKNQYELSLQNESFLRQAFDQQKAKVNEIKDYSIQYSILKREVDTNKELYKQLLQRVKEAEVSSGITASNIFIIDPAELPKHPFGPNKTRYFMLAAFLGFLLGIGLAFVFEFLDVTVKTPEDVKQLTLLPHLGSVPSLSNKNHGQGDAKMVHPIELLAFSAPHSLFSETLRNIRTSILLSSSGKPPKSIAITSPNADEGKTTFSTNVAIALSQTGAKVIVVDGDLRKPNIHKVFSDKNETGLSSFLSGNIPLEPIIKKTEIPNLTYILSGPIPPNPSELLGSTFFKTAIKSLGEKFDYIIVDCPPVIPFSDPLILSSTIEGIVLVVREGKTVKKALQQATASLLQVNAKILGVVVNGVNMQKSDYAYYRTYFHSIKGKGR